MNNFTQGQHPYKALNIGNDRRSKSLVEAMNTLKAALKEDPEYFIGWQANIAMQFQDMTYWYKSKNNKKYLNRKDIHTISNDAAKEFIKVLCM